MPAAERSPEVAAFIAAAQLYDDFDALLPLTPGGRAAVPPGPERERRLQLAVLLTAHVSYLCPEPPPVLRPLSVQPYLPDGFSDSYDEAFGRATNTSGSGAVERFLCTYHGGSGSRLAHIVRLYAESERWAATAQSPRLSGNHSTHARVLSVAMQANALTLLQDSQFQRAIDDELAALGDSPELPPGRQLPTARQLAHIFGCNAALGGAYMLMKVAMVPVAAMQFCAAAGGGGSRGGAAAGASQPAGLPGGCPLL